ncbi:MAG: diguanylate cyclase [Candidatus Thiodiazotropha sp.]
MSLFSFKPLAKRFLPAVFGIVFFLILVSLTEIIVYLLDAKNLERERSDVMDRVSTLRARLEGGINSTLHLTRGLIAYVATHPDVEEPDFSQLVSEILFQERNIRNIGLARNNIITHIYPLAGNESALGLTYEDNKDQWPAVLRAMEARGTIVAGPVKLVQGGTAFIARTPIYTRKGVSGLLSDHKPTYWGLASIVIDIPSLFQAAGIEQEVDGLRLALRGKDGLGEQGGMIFGEGEIFEQNPIIQSIVLPNGYWQIAAMPAHGWGSVTSMIWPARIAGWLVAILISLLIAALVKTRAINMELALHDPLTGLPNRRLMEDRLQQLLVARKRSLIGFGLIYIDLDGFKLVNDTYGHRFGDRLLKIAATRMQSSVRASDTVCRSGGDEFIILVNDVNSRGDLKKVEQQVIGKLVGNTLVDTQSIELRASSGIAFYPEDGDSIDSLLSTGDRNMYSDKQRPNLYPIKAR